MLILNLKIEGLLTSSGRLSNRKSIASLISLDASFRSVSQSNSRLMTERFSLETEVISFRLSTVLNASSSGRVTLVSTSLALAPGYVVRTEINGGSISG